MCAITTPSYNRQGAVPDTAPLGGDNRPAGCAGWADASVIVPWEMYLAYGDTRVLEEIMNAWRVDCHH